VACKRVIICKHGKRVTSVHFSFSLRNYGVITRSPSLSLSLLSTNACLPDTAKESPNEGVSCLLVYRICHDYNNFLSHVLAFREI
jgi:hypothetical protein